MAMEVSYWVKQSTETAEEKRGCLWPRDQVARRRRSGLLVAYRYSVGCCSRARSTHEEEMVVLLENGQVRKVSGHSRLVRIEVALFFLRNRDGKRNGWSRSSSRA